MQPFPPTIIFRHKRENLKKCSLRGLEGREDLRFFTYPTDLLPLVDGYILLTLDAPPLSIEDAGAGLLLIDATWRLAGKMIQWVDRQAPQLARRSLPTGHYTAYPRRQLDCPDPERGLASVEALFLAHQQLGRDCRGLLDNYHWREQFLQMAKVQLERVNCSFLA